MHVQRAPHVKGLEAAHPHQQHRTGRQRDQHADETEQVAKLGKKDENGPLPDGAENIYDLSMGRYDVAVDTGPSFTTKREESAQQMVEMIRAYPDAAPLIGDILVKALDWPQAEEIAERLKSMLPPQAVGGMPPQVQQMVEQGKEMIGKLQAENQQLKQKAQIDMMKAQLDAEKVKIEAYKAETERMQAEQAMAGPLPQVSPVSISMPEQVGGALAESLAGTVAPIIAQTIAQTMRNLPPLKIDQPRMRRVPIRDQNGLIVETIDEPIVDDPTQPMVN